MQQNTLAPWAETVPGAPRPMTSDDLLALREDEWQYELVDGRLVRMPPTGLEHLDVTDDLHAALRAYVKTHNLGRVTLPDTGFRLNRAGAGETILSPDIAFISTERAALLPARGTREARRFLSVTPDLAVEVASPEQHRPEMAAKSRIYLEAGVRFVWVIWPERRQVDVWQPGTSEPAATLTDAEQLDGLDVLPGFTYPIAQLFG